jgi:hypothetical protein
MTIREDGKLIANISMASQQLQGVWNEQYQMLDKLQIKLGDVLAKGVVSIISRR